MSDYIESLQSLIDGAEEGTAPAPATIDLSAYDEKLAAMEKRLAEVTEQNRKLTQLAVGEPVSSEDYNSRIKEAIETNPLAYTKEVVDTASSKAVEQVNQILAQQQEALAAQRAIDAMRTKYPEMAGHEVAIGAYADKIYNDIQTGNRKDITVNQYDRILEEAVKDFSRQYAPALNRQGHHVMSLDVGTQQSTVNGNNPMSQLMSLPDDKFLQAMNKIRSGHSFQF